MMEIFHLLTLFEGEEKMQRLEIDNFLSINRAIIELNDITLLIGPQAGGKSVIAKLFYYFRCIPNTLLQVVLEDEAKRAFDKEMKNKFSEIFPQYSWAYKTFKIIYKTDVGSISVSNNASNNLKPITIEYDEYYKNLIYQARYLFRKLYAKAEKEIHDDERSAYFDPIEMVERRLSEGISKFEFGLNQGVSKPIFIPSGRSFFSNIQTNVFSFLSNNLEIDYFLKEFGATYNTAKRIHDFVAARKRRVGKVVRKDIMSSVLGGEYQRERRKAREFIKSPDGRLTNVSNASSGQQESLPMLLVLSSLPYFRSNESNLYIIEEPEAHLFPKSQKQIVEMIVEIYNLFEKKNSYIITTHSPYVLAVLNVLAKAGRIRKKFVDNRLGTKKIEALYEVVPKYLQIGESCLAAYLISNNSAKKITEPETGLVNDEIIDKVSEDTSNIFEELLELEDI